MLLGMKDWFGTMMYTQKFLEYRRVGWLRANAMILRKQELQELEREKESEMIDYQGLLCAPA